LKSCGNQTTDILRGTTLSVYRFLVKSAKPVGVREVQRALNLSSPSVARYHLIKLESAKIIQCKNGNYVAAGQKVFLGNNVKISHLLVPRSLCHALLGVILLMVDATLISLVRDFAFASYFGVLSILILLGLFCFESAKAWS
jgi:hypothetical protein